MAKEQLAVIEMVTNMILGKTEGISKVDFCTSENKVSGTGKWNAYA